MLIIRGSAALAGFRKGKLLEKIQASLPSASGLEAQFVYFVMVEGELDAQELEILHGLLGETKTKAPLADVGNTVVVVPRIGTQSPWSSKATDIAHNCGLQKINRIERGISYQLKFEEQYQESDFQVISDALHDPMTQSVLEDPEMAQALFAEQQPDTLGRISLDKGIGALHDANQTLGLALTDEECEYLYNNYQRLERCPTDVELMMFAQANSEHCRHKIFNASWTIDGKEQNESLFAMIRYTHDCHSENVLSAYKDNAAVISGNYGERFFNHPESREYYYQAEPIHIMIKVETHNHPTAISPHPGASTGSGGEIRDEGATGRGAKPKAGLTGFSVSHLHLPENPRAWEFNYGKPLRIASALDIMLEAPIGGAAFNNEFGRPNLAGYFRSFCLADDKEIIRGYHKPIMIAGGMGNIRENHVQKQEIPIAAKIIILGGPAMQIGLGGGAASSVAQGQRAEDLDFASVQRDNPEMERRCQEVIDACVALGDDNPIYSIHDVGAGGLSNALPELIHDAGRGGEFHLRQIPNAEPGMSPLAIWCNEAQERYVLAIADQSVPLFTKIAERERCPFAIVGQATENTDLKLHDSHFDNHPIDLPLEVILGKPPKMHRDTKRQNYNLSFFDTETIAIEEAVRRVLQHPTVADKSFLITIGDRSITGLVARDQMVGPWQIPVADVAVTANSFLGYQGEAMAIGERAPIALINPAASGRMAIGEMITNMAAANISQLSDIKLSANWMAAANHPGEDAALFDTVQAVGKEFCPALGLTIPVGKDSLSMRSLWQEEGEEKAVVAPLSLVTTGFAPVQDIRKTLTPVLKAQTDLDTTLLLIDLAQGKQRLGGSILTQVYNSLGDTCPDVENPEVLKQFFDAMQDFHQAQLLYAYHDRSDGGLWASLCEMAFAGHCGLDINLAGLGEDVIASLFNEELGAVIQVASSKIDQVQAILEKHGLAACSHPVAKINYEDKIRVSLGYRLLFEQTRTYCQRLWSETSYRMQSLRDNPICAEQAYANLLTDDPGLFANLKFDLNNDITAPFINSGAKPKMAILREQGVNGHIEMAAAFHKAGFNSIDVHMQDLLAGNVELKDFQGLVACGGFSYGDVLGAGQGWAKSILYHQKVREMFEQFFTNPNTITLGVCNGCQMLSTLKDLIPGASHWPQFLRNRSEQFEARLSMVEVTPSPSIFFAGMAGSQIPVVVAHGEGRAHWENKEDKNKLVALKYIDNYGHTTEQYPYNPNGSPEGATGLCNEDGRVTIMMPHPERVFRSVQMSWHPDDWQEASPWLRLFRNARLVF